MEKRRVFLTDEPFFTDEEEKKEGKALQMSLLLHFLEKEVHSVTVSSFEADHRETIIISQDKRPSDELLEERLEMQEVVSRHTSCTWRAIK